MSKTSTFILKSTIIHLMTETGMQPIERKSTIIQALTADFRLPHEMIDHELLGTTELQETLHLFAALGNHAENYSLFIGNERGCLQALIPPEAKLDVFAAVLIDPRASGDEDDLINVLRNSSLVQTETQDLNGVLQQAYTSALHSIINAGGYEGGLEMVNAFAHKLKNKRSSTAEEFTVNTDEINTLLIECREEIQQKRTTGVLPDSPALTIEQLGKFSSINMEKKAEELRSLQCTLIKTTWPKIERSERTIQILIDAEAQKQIEETVCCGGLGFHFKDCPKAAVTQPQTATGA